MRNRRNANFYEENKYYNTNQNNTNVENLDNNHSKKNRIVSTPISEAEISSEFDNKQQEYKEVLEGGRKYYNNQLLNKNTKSK